MFSAALSKAVETIFFDRLSRVRLSRGVRPGLKLPSFPVVSNFLP